MNDEPAEVTTRDSISERRSRRKGVCEKSWKMFVRTDFKPRPPPQCVRNCELQIPSRRGRTFDPPNDLERITHEEETSAQRFHKPHDERITGW